MNEEITMVTIKVDVGDTTLIRTRIPFRGLRIYNSIGGEFESTNEDFQAILDAIQKSWRNLIIPKEKIHES